MLPNDLAVLLHHLRKGGVHVELHILEEVAEEPVWPRTRNAPSLPVAQLVLVVEVEGGGQGDAYYDPAAVLHFFWFVAVWLLLSSEKDSVSLSVQTD